MSPSVFFSALMIMIAVLPASHAIADKAVVTTNADAPGSVVVLNKPFSQVLTCYAGIKPYFDRAAVGPRTISFDGDQLAIAGNAQVDSGRFSTSGHDIVRTNNQTSATLHTHRGARGGKLWFERDLNGKLISAGIVHRPGADRIECGDEFATQWLDDALPKSFGRDGQKLTWQTGTNIALQCVQYAGTDLSAARNETPEMGQLHRNQNGALSLTLADQANTIISLSHTDGTNRSASFVHETVRDGGQRIWISRRDTDGEIDALTLRFRFNYNLLDLEQRQAGKLSIRCVPAPLDPRRFVDS
ncbi:MAG: hypothetical protein AB8C46_16860 [Burkholderiaceae bacterium]